MAGSADPSESCPPTNGPSNATLSALPPDHSSTAPARSRQALASERVGDGLLQKSLPGQRKEGSRPANIAVGHGMAHTAGALNPTSSPRQPGAMATVQGPPRRSSSPFSASQSPHRGMTSSSPRRISPATSQIFERDVQESTNLAPELSPAIPSHIQTEDHIPPVLEASSLAISENLDPDEVEIVTHPMHQAAATSVASSSLGESQIFSHGSHTELSVFQDPEDIGSGYGKMDPQDPRRLSFISFADVVNAEHAEVGKDATGGTNMSSTSPSAAGNRSPSPVRSPASMDRAPFSPPTSGSFAFKGVETSPVRGGAASTVSGTSLPIHGDITIETMRQTLQKTGSNDIAAGTGSQPLSAVSAEDGRDHSFR